MSHVDRQLAGRCQVNIRLCCERPTILGDILINVIIVTLLSCLEIFIFVFQAHFAHSGIVFVIVGETQFPIHWNNLCFSVFDEKYI